LPVAVASKPLARSITSRSPSLDAEPVTSATVAILALSAAPEPSPEQPEIAPVATTSAAHPTTLHRDIGLGPRAALIPRAT
jgi:hypothetical protein